MNVSSFSCIELKNIGRIGCVRCLFFVLSGHCSQGRLCMCPVWHTRHKQPEAETHQDLCCDFHNVPPKALFVKTNSFLQAWYSQTGVLRNGFTASTHMHAGIEAIKNAPGICAARFKSSGVRPVRVCVIRLDQAATATPLSLRCWASSPEAYISRTMSQPPTNSPLT